MEAPEYADSIGEQGILHKQKIGFFCSLKCPGSLILQTYDMMQLIRNSNTAIISGFHSPMEKECLNILLRGSSSIIICPARSIQDMRIPMAYRKPISEGRLLLLSPFGVGEHRSTVEQSLYRNKVVAALSDKVFVAHASPGGKTEEFCKKIIQWGKPLYTFASDYNTNLINMGAIPITLNDIDKLLIPETSS